MIARRKYFSASARPGIAICVMLIAAAVAHGDPTPGAFDSGGDASGATPGGDGLFVFGDMNQDGVVDGLDIDPFVQALTNGQNNPAGDMNRDGTIDGLDIDPFVQALTGSDFAGDPSSGDQSNDPAAAPTPTAATAAVLLGALSLLRRRRRA